MLRCVMSAKESEFGPLSLKGGETGNDRTSQLFQDVSYLTCDEEQISFRRIKMLSRFTLVLEGNLTMCAKVLLSFSEKDAFETFAIHLQQDVGDDYFQGKYTEVQLKFPEMDMLTDCLFISRSL